jgi:hypothetical protein
VVRVVHHNSELGANLEGLRYVGDYLVVRVVHHNSELGANLGPISHTTRVVSNIDQ